MKSMNLAKILTWALALSMAFTLVSCSGENGTNNNAGAAPTITYMLPSDPGLTFTGDSWIFKNWGEQANVKIEINSPPRDSFNVKIAALFASGQLPDVINYYQDAQTKYYKQYGPQFFVPLDDYLSKDKLPGLKRWLDKYPDIREAMNHPEDKKLYGFPLVYDLEAFDSVFTVRNDMLKKGGMDASEIKTLDDFKNALLALKKASGQKYIASSRLGWNYFSLYLGKFMGTGPDMVFDNRLPSGTNKYIYGPSSAQYKKFLEFANWMYKNEVLHPSFATMEQQELFAGYSDGKFLVSMEQVTMGMTLGGNDPVKYPDREEKAIFPVAIDGVVPMQNEFLHQNNGFRWPATVSKTSKNIDAAMRMMDWLYTDEGIYSNRFGKEGEHWVKDDSYFYGAKVTGTQSYSTDLLVKQGKMSKEDYDKLPTVNDLGGLGSYWLMGVIQADNRFGLLDRPKDIVKEKPFTTFIKDNVEYGLKNGYTTGKTDPIVDFSKEEMDTMATIKTTLDTFASENSMKFITGDKPLSEFDSFVAELEKLGSKKIEDMYNAKLK